MAIFRRLHPRHRRLLLRALKLAAVVVLLAGSAVLFTNLAVLNAADARMFTDPNDVPSRHVAIVLGARVQYDGTPSSPLAQRLDAALRLYRLGKVNKVLVSGDHGAPEYDEPNAMRDWLLARGVPPEDVFTDHAGFRTYDTMRRARDVFAVRDAVICTQEFHLPRSIFLARDSGIDAVGLVARDGVNPASAFNAIRETLARSKAWLDAKVVHAGYVGGPQIPITGDGQASYDGE